ncbi:hypothetical protein, partial [Micromonospora sp. ATA51]|uniref:hypothetical protein n=1 Tax=Micromonospora sp. ATA51 TaxID=2806098 RepID=UPI001EE44561
GVEEVQRDLVRVQLGELRGELGALLDGLAEAEVRGATERWTGVRKLRALSNRCSSMCTVFVNTVASRLRIARRNELSRVVGR